MPDLVGRTLRGRYRVDELVGEGMMAQVWRAWDQHRACSVALKVMRADYAEDLDFLRYFEREAAALAALHHPRIVRFYSIEQDGDLTFLVLDYIEGQTLRKRLADAGGPLPLVEVVRIAQQVCSALTFAHRENFIHRDIKPDNVLLTDDGRAFLSDFGVARLGAAATSTMFAFAGTPAYLAPECWHGRRADARSDIYSLGVTLYEMLAGRRPFLGQSGSRDISVQEQLRHEHLAEVPPSLRWLNPNVSAGVEAAVLKSLAKDPALRWQNAQDLARALEEADRREHHTLQVTTVPDGAQLFLNGEWRGSTPVTLTDLPSNVYLLRLEKSGYRFNETEVNPSQDRAITVTLETGGERTVADPVWCGPDTDLGPKAGADRGKLVLAAAMSAIMVTTLALVARSSIGVSDDSPGQVNYHADSKIISVPQTAVTLTPTATAGPISSTESLAATKAIVEKVVTASNQVWSSAIAKNGTQIDSLPQFYSGNWLHEVQSAISEMRSRGQYRVAVLLGTITIRSALRLSHDRIEAFVAEDWDDRLYDADGRLLKIYPNHVEQRYLIKLFDGEWFIIESKIVRY